MIETLCSGVAVAAGSRVAAAAGSRVAEAAGSRVAVAARSRVAVAAGSRVAAAAGSRVAEAAGSRVAVAAGAGLAASYIAAGRQAGKGPGGEEATRAIACMEGHGRWRWRAGRRRSEGRAFLALLLETQDSGRATLGRCL
jgi:hypothetical protein